MKAAMKMARQLVDGTRRIVLHEYENGPSTCGPGGGGRAQAIIRPLRFISPHCMMRYFLGTPSTTNSTIAMSESHIEESVEANEGVRRTSLAAAAPRDLT